MTLVRPLSVREQNLLQLFQIVHLAVPSASFCLFSFLRRSLEFARLKTAHCLLLAVTFICLL